MDGVMCDFETAVWKLFPEAQHLHEEDPIRKEFIDKAQSVPHFWREMPPMSGALDAFAKLSDKYEMFLLSAPSWADPLSYSEKREWVGDHLGLLADKKLILTHHKNLFTGRALIDDRIKYGVDGFKGEHIHFGTPKFPNWDAVLAYLL